MRLKLSELCKRRGASIHEFCESTGIGYRSALHWDAGEHLPSRKTLERIADYFGVEPDEMFAMSRSPGVDGADERGCAPLSNRIEAPFWWLPRSFAREWLAELTGAEFKVLACLLSCADRRGEAFPKQETIAEWIGADVRTVRRALDSLSARGFLTVEKADRRNVYRIDIPERPAESGECAKKLHTEGAEKFHIPDMDVRCPESDSRESRDSRSRTRINESDSSDSSDDAKSFAEFKEIYPKRRGGYDWADAQKRFERWIKTIPVEVILRGARNYAEFCSQAGRIGTEYVKMPSTWLNRRGWEEEYEAAPSGARPTEDEYEEQKRRFEAGEIDILGRPIKKEDEDDEDDEDDETGPGQLPRDR